MNNDYTINKGAMRRSLLSISILVGCLGASSSLIAAPITAPQEITANGPETVWNSDSPIMISNNNGIMVNGGKLTLNDVTIDINGTRNAGYGLGVSNGGEMRINGGTFEHVFASSVSPALRVTDGGKMYIDGLRLNSSKRYDNSGSYLATVSQPGGYLEIKNSVLTTTSGSLLNMVSGGEIYLDNTELHVSGDGYYSIQLLHSGNRFTGNNLKIVSDVSGPESRYLFLIHENNDFSLLNSEVTSNKGQSLFYNLNNSLVDNVTFNYVSNSADASGGLFAILTTGENAVFNLNNSTLNVSGDKTVVGVLANKKGGLIANNTLFNITGNAQAIQLNNGYAELNDSQVFVERAEVAAIRGINEANVTLNNTQITAEGWVADMTQGDMMINASGASTVLNGKTGGLLAFARTGDSVMTVKLSDGASLMGNVETRQKDDFVSMLALSLTNGAKWTGNSLNVDEDGASTGVINVSVDNAGWAMTDDSSVDALDLNDGTVALFDASATARSASFTPKVLTVNALSGSGNFVLRTDIVGDGAGNNQGDRLRVTGASAGSHRLQVLNNGSAQTDGSEVLTVVETSDGVAQFALNNEVELGGYLYNVRQNGTHWELFGTPSDPNPGPGITTTADAGANFLNVGYLMNYAENQTLLQRMGDLRQNGEHGDMWMRGFAGKFDSFSGGKLSRFDMSYSGVQIGADKRISVDMPLFVGAFLGQTHGSPDYRTGDGTTNHQVQQRRYLRHLHGKRRFLR